MPLALGPSSLIYDANRWLLTDYREEFADMLSTLPRRRYYLVYDFGDNDQETTVSPMFPDEIHNMLEVLYRIPRD